MSFWRRLFRRDEPPQEQPPLPAEPAAPAPTRSGPVAEIEALLAADPVSPDRAIALLRAARGTRDERGSIDAVVASHRERRVPEPVRVLAADLLVQRGQSDEALALLDGCTSASGLVLSADVRADRGEVARALALIERVLARDIDSPGARERRERWRERLGGVPVETPGSNEATVLRHELPDTTLRIVGEAGRGGAGTVYEAMDDVFGRRVAFKVYHRPEEEREKLEREARMAVSFAGPGVVRILDADPVRGWIVMEWVGGGALRRVIRQGDDAWLRPIERWFRPLVRAVGRVHARGFVHADLKPANVLMRGPGEPILSDFGIARPIGEAPLGGTIGFLSPERLEGAPLSPSEDVYALGRILEDAVEAAVGVAEADRWREVVRRATAPAGERPADAVALLDTLRNSVP